MVLNVAEKDEEVAADETVLLCTWEMKKEEDEGLVIHSTTSSTCSGCIACPLPNKRERPGLPLKGAARPPFSSADAQLACPLLAVGKEPLPLPLDFSSMMTIGNCLVFSPN